MEALEPLVFPSIVVPTYTQQQLPTGAYFPADCDSDGDTDFLDYREGILICSQRQADGSYVTYQAGAYASRRSLQAAVDVDLDGDLDLIASGGSAADGSSDLIIWQLNDGTGHFGAERSQSLRLPSYGVSTISTDLNRDGNPDLVVNYTQVFGGRGTALYFNDGAGGFSPPTILNGVGFDTGGSSAAADFDGDDDVDLAIPMLQFSNPSISGVVRILRNDGHGSFAFWQDLNLGGNSSVVATADLDDDGDIDLLGGSTQGATQHLVVLSNDGAGNFPTRANVALPSSISETLLVSDLNGDSAIDVVTSSWVTLLMNDGTGQLAPAASFVNNQNSQHWYRIGDLDFDGRRDILSGSATWLASGFTDTLRPVASRPAYVYNPQAGSPALRVDFSEDVSRTLRAADFQLTNLTTDQPIPTADLKLKYSAGDIASLLMPSSLPDGNYRLTIAATAVADIAGNTLASDFTFDFAVLAGDANRDRKIDANDLAILSANWQGTSKTFSQGDFNYDGKVDIQDLYILASKWQQALPPPALPAIPAATTPARRTPTRVAASVLT